MKKFAPIAGWLTLIFGFATLFFYIVLPDLKPLILSLSALSISNGAFSCSPRERVLEISFLPVRGNMEPIPSS